MADDPLPVHRFGDQAQWQEWLHSHQEQPRGVWLQMAKKHHDEPTVTYAEALDVALCYGWIDGQRKTLDDNHFIQKFTPRRRGSLWSKRNVDKVAILIAEGRMQPAGQAEIDRARADGRWERAYAPPSTIEVPDDFAAALAEQPNALTFFATLNKTQRYSFLWRIETAKRADTRARRIAQFVALLAEEKTL